MRAAKIALLSLLVGCITSVGFGAANPVEGLKSFSEFGALDLSRLLDGEILGERGSPMDFPQGIFAQTCFAVPLPAVDAAQRLQARNPSGRDAPNVLAFQSVRAPCEAADFLGLTLRPTNNAVRWLLDRSLKTTASRSELNLTLGEARDLAACARTNPHPQGVSACWARLLLERAQAFQRQGFAGVPSYESGGKTVSPAAHLRAMLREKPAVAREFTPLLERCGFYGSQVTEPLTPAHYWGLYEADRRGTLVLGAFYSLAVGDRHQLLNAQYYVSGAYYTFVTLYEIWPIQAGGKSGALVWRGDFFAAPTLALTRGTERLAYGAIMMLEVKKAVRCLQNDLATKP